MTKRHKPMLKLTVRRREKQLTQGELAELVGVKYNTISAYETGQNFPRRETLERLAAALDCAPGDLI